MVRLGFLNLAIALARSAAFIGGVEFSIQRRKLAPIFPAHASRTRHARELRVAVRVLLFDSLVVGLVRGLGYLPFRFGGAVEFLLAFVLTALWFELWFYVTHRLLHTRLFYRFHVTHHSYDVPNALTSLCFSLPERLTLLTGSVVVPALLYTRFAFSTAGVFAYFTLNYFLNACLHSNHSLFQGWPGRVLYGAEQHGLHHVTRNKNYGLFVNFFDVLGGTHAPDLGSASRTVQRFSSLG